MPSRPEIIYVVQGFCGDYEEQSYWNVAAFRSKVRAQSRAGKCTAWVKSNTLRGGNKITLKGCRTGNPYDEHMITFLLNALAPSYDVNRLMFYN